MRSLLSEQLQQTPECPSNQQLSPFRTPTLPNQNLSKQELDSLSLNNLNDNNYLKQCDYSSPSSSSSLLLSSSVHSEPILISSKKSSNRAFGLAHSAPLPIPVASNDQNETEKENINWKRDSSNNDEQKLNFWSYSFPSYENDDDLIDEISDSFQSVNIFQNFHKNRSQTHPSCSSQIKIYSNFIPPHQLTAKGSRSIDDRPMRKDLVRL